MTELFNLIKEPLFWLLTPIVGLFWSVLGNLVTPFFQKYLSQLYQSRNRKRVSSILENRAKVERFFISYSERDSTKIDVIHGLLTAISIMVVGTGLLLLANLLPHPSKYLAYFIGVYAFYLGIKVIDKQHLLLGQVKLAQERELALDDWMNENNVAPSETNIINGFLVQWDSIKFNISETELLEHSKSS
ncbi:MAG: hypothetical protein CTY33_02865 [Methylotenera sp.]|nr:MAG: hypothetical protein CTY33_02865 [Methylotenera sp.]